MALISPRASADASKRQDPFRISKLACKQGGRFDSSGYYDTSTWKRDAEFPVQHATIGPIPMDWDYSNGFPYFEKFPGELRNMIWEFAIPDERIITISKVPHKNKHCGILKPCTRGCYDGSNRQCVGHGFRAHPDIELALLQTCWESRSIALKYHKPAFEHQLVFPTFYSPARYRLAFPDQFTLLDFVSGEQPGDAEALRQLGLREIIIQSVPESQRQYSGTNLFAGLCETLNISKLDCWEIIGFACMRLGAINRVLFKRRMSSLFSKETVLGTWCWKEQAKAQAGIYSFIAKWIQCNYALERYFRLLKARGEPLPPRPVDLACWQHPEVKVLLAKYTIGCSNKQPFSLSTSYV